jgi:hypothetical protein
VFWFLFLRSIYHEFSVCVLENDFDSRHNRYDVVVSGVPYCVVGG